MAVAKQGILQKRIKKPSVANTVMQRVYDALLEGEIKPGDLLPSEMLSAIGVVESVQGEGTFIRTSIDEAAVNPMTYQMVLMQGANEQILELRYCIEPAYTLLAMRKATPEDLEKIHDTVVNLERKICTNSQTAQDDLAIHEAILDAPHNPYLIRIGKTILQLFEASIQKSMCNIPDQALEDHRRIIEAFEQKDSDALHEAVLKSFVGWEEMLYH